MNKTRSSTKKWNHKIKTNKHLWPEENNELIEEFSRKLEEKT